LIESAIKKQEEEYYTDYASTGVKDVSLLRRLQKICPQNTEFQMREKENSLIAQ